MLKCAQCPFSTENKSELSLHTFLKHKKDSDSKKRKNSSPSNSKAAAEKKSKIECSKCDFVAQEQFYMDIHKEVCKGQEAVEAVSEDEVEAENDGNVANGPPTPKVEDCEISVNGATMYECYVCGTSTKAKDDMINHINAEHKRSKSVQKTPKPKLDKIVEKPTTESAKKRFHCSDCDASFSRKAYLNKHQKTKHGDQNGEEGKLNLTFPLEAKEKSPEPLEKIEDKTLNFHQCLDCDRRFPEKSLLKKHCSLKGHAFLKEEPSSSTSIENDKKPENEKRDEEKMKRIFKCDEDGCGFKSKFLIALKKHKCNRVVEMKSSGGGIGGVTSQLTPKSSSSSQVRPESRPETPKATTKSSFKISLKKKQQTQLPKLACAKCNFVTTDETKYNRHIVVHDLEEDEENDETPNSPMDAILKPYKCIEVQCTFQTDISKELSKHIRTSHSKEKRKYECDTCDFATFSYLALIHHFESCESEEKDNSCSKIQTTKCQLCDFSHATDAGIIDHILKSHVPQKPKNAKIITKIPLIKLNRI